jgi:hypothetical protein
MTFATSLTRERTRTRAAVATTFDHARPPVVHGALHRAGVMMGDLFGVVGLVLCVPFVILAIGIPIALGLRFLLWLVGML